MSEQLLECGMFTLTKCCARCDACRELLPAYQLTGPNGWITLCRGCFSIALAHVWGLVRDETAKPL